MDEDRKIEGALRRLYGRVEPSGAWAGIEARAAGGKGRKVKLESDVQYVRTPQVRSRRLRWALYVPLALFLVAGIAIGTVFAVDQSQEPSTTGSGDGTQTSATIPPAADYSRGGQWKRLAPSGAGGLVSRMVMDPADPQVLYAMTGEGLYKTNNGAGSWRKILEFGGEVAVDPVAPSTVYVVKAWSESSQILRSDDGGASWTELDNSIFAKGDPKKEDYDAGMGGFGATITIGDTEFSTVYLVGADNLTWCSVDRGETWSKVTWTELQNKTQVYWMNPRLASPLELYGKTIEDAEDGLAAVVEVAVAAPDDSSVIYAGTTGGGVYKSVDGAATWRRSSTGMTSLPVYGLVPDPVSPAVLYAITESGIQKSADGGSTWNLILAGGRFMGDPVEQGRLVGSRSGAMTSMVIAPSLPSTLYAWNGKGVSRSEDGGSSWNHRAGEGLLTVGGKHTGYTGGLALVSAADPNLVFAQAEAGIMRSTDGGDTWTGVTGMYDSWGLMADSNQSSVLYLTGLLEERRPPTREEVEKGTWNHPPSYLFKSSDAGATWTLVVDIKEAGISTQLGLDNNDPARFWSWVMDEDSDTLGARLMRSKDGGLTWQQLDFSALGPYFEQPLFDPRSPETVYTRVVSQKGENYSLAGVFRSTDGGLTWKNIVDELVADDMSLTLAISPADGTLYATSPRGLFKWAPKD
jgi:photosystem II stability/assembly factor-like uncharacterized protein